MTTALVTGSARRIGAAIAGHLAAAGYDIALHHQASGEDAGALAARLRQHGRRVAVLKADLADPAAIRTLVADAAALGPLALLVNNAALFEDDRIGGIDPATFDRHIAVNLRAPLLLTEAFAQNAAPGASIVNIIDQRVLKPTPDHISYALSKSALWSLTRMSAQALAPAIRVNAVAPGPTLPNREEGATGFAGEAAAVPLARPVAPEAIAEAVLYLARAAHVTGQMIAVDSGQHIAWRTPDVIAVER